MSILIFIEPMRQLVLGRIVRRPKLSPSQYVESQQRNKFGKVRSEYEEVHISKSGCWW
jgi:hypothetical protein